MLENTYVEVTKEMTKEEFYMLKEKVLEMLGDWFHDFNEPETRTFLHKMTNEYWVHDDYPDGSYSEWYLASIDIYMHYSYKKKNLLFIYDGHREVWYPKKEEFETLIEKTFLD